MLHLVLSILAIASPILAVTPASGGKYTISPKAFPNLCLAPEYDHEGSLVVTKNCDTSSDIVWTFNGAQFTNTQTNTGFDVRDGGQWNGNKLQVWTQYAWNPNQQFILPNEQIQWAGTNLVLDLTNGAGVAGTNIQLWTGYGHNTNQMWEFVDAEEIEECQDGSAPVASSTPSSAVPASASYTGSAASQTTTGAGASSTTGSASDGTATTTALGNNQLIANPGATSSSTTTHSASASTKTRKGSKSTSTASASMMLGSASHTATASTSTASAASSSASSGSSSSGGTYSSGFTGSILRTSGTKIVDGSGNQVVLRGTNLGGWLVFEDWMCGISDTSGNADRFPQWTLESRFGITQTAALMKTWMDNWLVAGDWDQIKSLGFNMVRLPFSYRNFINSDGSDNAVGFQRLDWAFSQAKRVGIYVIPVYHIWDTQKERYSMISEDNSEGQAARASASALWVKIASRYANEPIIAAWDLINEPTGSANDNLQQALYNAVRSVDQNHILIQASLSTNPSNYGWTNVVYTQHEYLMMGDDYNSNIGAYWNGPGASISQFQGMNIPAYIGEFMADGQTLQYMLTQLNIANVWWSHWAFHTVNMGRWGLYNYGSGMSVDVSNDSFSSIQNAWSNMGSASRQAVADQYQTYTGGRNWKREESENIEKKSIESPRVKISLQRGATHAGRSRRSQIHGGLIKTSF